jgi:hypothetical protein
LCCSTKLKVFILSGSTKLKQYDFLTAPNILHICEQHQMLPTLINITKDKPPSNNSTKMKPTNFLQHQTPK